MTFHYKSDQNPSGRRLQYGLIAEEVAEVYPGLVARSADGQIETVLYQFLPPMLLNEYQRQERTIDALRAQNEMLRENWRHSASGSRSEIGTETDNREAVQAGTLMRHREANRCNPGATERAGAGQRLECCDGVR